MEIIFTRLNRFVQKKSFFYVAFTIFWLPSAFAQKQTSVAGSVLDAASRAPVPFASVSVTGTTTGVVSDENGIFELNFMINKAEIQISAVGYRPLKQSIKIGEKNTINILLQPEATQLHEVIVNPGKYKNRNNPAVELIKKVIAHKSDNRLESRDYYEYQKYEKVELDFVNVGEDFKKKRLMKNFQFVFANEDTTRLRGKRLLPGYLKEALTEIYYRKNPESKKERTIGEKQSELEGLLDADGLGEYVGRLYASVNIYDNSILLVNKQFLSPIAPMAPSLYRFYIMDTSVVEGVRCIHLSFFPRNKADLTFVGNLYVTDDTAYAVRKVDLTLPDEININFLNSLRVVQQFERSPDGGWTQTRDEVSIDFGVGSKEKGFGIYGTKVTSFKNFVFNQPKAESFYSGAQIKLKEKSAKVQSEEFWKNNRHETLRASESSVYTTIDSIKKVPDYKTFRNWSTLLLSGFWPGIKGLEFGPFSGVYSFNPIEGGKFRLAGRTTPAFNKHIGLEASIAYTTLDQRIKYGGAITYQFNETAFNEFPQNALKLSYRADAEVPGQDLQNVHEDNFFLSFRRGKFDKIYYKEALALTYTHENESHFSWQTGLQRNFITPGGVLTFQKWDAPTNSYIHLRSINSNEAFIGVRYAPNEEFFQGKTYRRRIVNQYPVLRLQYRFGHATDKGNDFNYHFIMANVFKRFYLTPIGHTDFSIEAGRLFNKVPYPLLITHHANQTLSYQAESFNMMNNLEFVSDKYASFNMTHYFDGFFLNKIPLVKKLKLREIATFKAIYGGLDVDNLPQHNSKLYLFPKHELTQQSYIHSFLPGTPYMEASVGVGNIFKILRVDLIRRLNYLNHPDVSMYGVRLKLKLEF